MRASEFTPRKKSNKVAESAWHKRMSFEQLVQYIIDYLGPEPSDSAIVDAVKGEAEDAGVDPNKLFDAVYDRIRPHVEEDWQKVNKHDKTDGMSKKYFGEGKDLNNFTVDDIRELELIRDLNVLKQQAIALISKPSKRPMDPEKVQWFRSKIDSLQRPTQVIKLMYDLLLSGEGNAVIGDRYSTKKNNYRQTFGESIDEDWQKVNKHDKTDGMSKKAVSAYRREHPGSKLKTAVTKKPSKLKKGSKDANRRKSFCARMKGMKKSRASAKTKHNPDSPINKALRRWNCESIEEMRDMIVYAEQKISLLKEAANPAQQAAIAIAKKKEQGVDEKWSAKYKKSINCSHPKGFSQRAHCAGKKKHNESVTLEMVCPECGMCQSHGNLNEIKKGQKDSNGVTKCWPGYRAQGTKKGKNGGQVRNCVKIGEGWEHEMARLLRLLESK